MNISRQELCYVSKDIFRKCEIVNLNWRGEMGNKSLVDTSFIRDNALVTTGVLRYMIKWSITSSWWIQACM